jgi:hypothetical protein
MEELTDVVINATLYKNAWYFITKESEIYDYSRRCI